MLNEAWKVGDGLFRLVTNLLSEPQKATCCLLVCYREKDLTAKCIIKMEGNRTSISHLRVRGSVFSKASAGGSSNAVLCSLQLADGVSMETTRERTKTFTYDFSYDSSDSKGSAFVSQEKVERQTSDGS